MKRLKFLIRLHVHVVMIFMSSATWAQSLVFVEQDGLLVMEAESGEPMPAQWAVETEFSGFTGLAYLRYAATNQLNNPGVGLMRFPIRITNPGLYRFEWRNLIAEGTSTTDSNDSWLRITATAFYGLQGQNSIVCPKGYDPMINHCPVELDDDGNVTPEGSGSDGWFKVYRSGQGEWVWSTRTSDSDAHNIFARFDVAGEYLIEVSGRSENHAIDRLILHRNDYNGNPRDITLEESPQQTANGVFSDGFEQF